MIHEQNTRFAIVIGTSATTATTADVFDRYDTTNDIIYNHATIRACLIKSGDTTAGAGWTSLIVQEASSTGGTYTAISTSGTDFTAPTHTSSTAAHIVELQIPLEGRERYLKVLGTTDGTNTTTYATCVTFSRGTQSPSTDSERGANEVVFVT